MWGRGGNQSLLLATYKVGQRKHALCFSFSLDFIIFFFKQLGIKTTYDISGTNTYTQTMILLYCIISPGILTELIIYL